MTGAPTTSSPCESSRRQTMTNPDRQLVEVFRREYRVNRNLDAAVAAVAAAVLARVQADRPRPTAPVQLHALATGNEPPKRAKVEEETVDAVLTAVAALHGEPPKRLFSRRWKTRVQATARWVASSVLCRMGMSETDIAVAVGYADHTTVLYGLRQVEARAELAAQAELVWREINGGEAQAQAQGAEAAA
jgi:chromosomal replication initiation ATPase DnaA